MTAFGGRHKTRGGYTGSVMIVVVVHIIITIVSFIFTIPDVGSRYMRYMRYVRYGRKPYVAAAGQTRECIPSSVACWLFTFNTLHRLNNTNGVVIVQNLVVTVSSTVSTACEVVSMEDCTYLWSVGVIMGRRGMIGAMIGAI